MNNEENTLTYNAWSYNGVDNVKSSWCQITLSSFIPQLTNQSCLVICFYLFQKDNDRIKYENKDYTFNIADSGENKQKKKAFIGSDL